MSSAGPGWRTGDAALRVGAILPQLFEGAVLQDVDVIDRQPGLGLLAGVGELTMRAFRPLPLLGNR